MPGPGSDWPQPLYGDKPVLGGRAIGDFTIISRDPVYSGAHLLGMSDGSSVIQVDYRSPGHPEVAKYYRWTCEQQAAEAADWDHVDGLANLGRAVWFVPYDRETERWIASAGETSFALVRNPAADKEPLFDAAAYPMKADLNGVAQTIVTSAPSAGEVQVVGKAVTTPALSAGDILEIRYYPAYPVLVPNTGHRQRVFNHITRTIVVAEAARQEPA